MASDNGKQVITFRYQQEGTAEGFNKILHGVMPRGVISGGTLIKEDNSTVSISYPLQMIIGDNNVTIHVETQDYAHVGVAPDKPFVIATFNWANLADNYVKFTSSAFNDLPTDTNAIILGKCEFTGADLSTTFDYTRKTWSSAYYNNDFLYPNDYRTHSPSFNVTPHETTPNLSFNVGVGKAIIRGKEVEIGNSMTVVLQSASPTDPNYFNPNVTNSRIDLAVITDSGTVEYIMGDDSLNPHIPVCPSYGLPIAKFTYGSFMGITEIKGSNIQYIYNNNYIGLAPTIGKNVNGSVINEHTLYI